MLPEYDDTEPMPLRQYRNESLNPGDAAVLHNRWYSFVEDYSSRFMTKESDKLPALAGLAAKSSNKLDLGIYVAGIWSTHLPSALLWRTVQLSEIYTRKVINPLATFQPRHPQQHRGPSWSWASIDGEINYDSQRCQRPKIAA